MEMKELMGKLREAAGKASKGQWFTLGQPWCHSERADLAVLAGSPDPHKASNIVADLDLTHEWTEGEPDGSVEDRNNARYIALANPANVLRLLDRIAELEGALEVISSKNKPRHETEEYWLKISHEQCATVLATDTKIARQALKEKE